MKKPLVTVFLAMWHSEYINVLLSVTFRLPRVGNVAKFRLPGCQVAKHGYWHPDRAEDSLKMLHFKAVPARSWCFGYGEASRVTGMEKVYIIIVMRHNIYKALILNEIRA